MVCVFSFRSTTIFCADLKKSTAEATPTKIIIDIAQRKDSVPRDGASKSLIMPTTNGPKPKPIRFSTRNKIAEVSARIEAGTRLCATAIDGPRYILCSKAQQPKKSSDKDVFCRKMAPAEKKMDTSIAKAGTF